MHTINSKTVTAENSNKEILRQLCKQHGIKNYGKLNNAQMRIEINKKLAVATMFSQAIKKVTETTKVKPVNSWMNMLAPATPKQAKKQRLGNEVTKKQRVRNNQTYPKSGGKTYAVWVQMRYYLAVQKLPLKQAKARVRAWGAQNKQMPNMVNAQIYRFCKYYGLIGK